MSKVEVPAREHLILGAPRSAHASSSRQPNEPTSQRPRRPKSSVVTASALWTFAAVAGLALWLVVHALVLTSLQEHGNQARLRAQFRGELGLATAPMGGSINPGSPVARLDLGSDGLHSLIVVEGTTAGDLTRGPGHLSDTPLPGQPGVSVLLGRSVTYGAPFRSISRLQVGDKIKVTTGQGTFTYRVDRIRRPGDTLPPPLAANGSRLMLVTSAASGWRSGWAPDHMIFLDASLERGEVQLPPEPRPMSQA